jgi:hypothetical protein
MFIHRPRTRCVQVTRRFSPLQRVGIILWIFLPLLALAADPFVIPTSDKTYGPDGPWQAISVQVGQSPVDLYPGSTWETTVFGDTFCDDSSNGACLAEDSLYNESDSISINKAFDRYHTSDQSTVVLHDETLVYKSMLEMIWMVEPIGSAVESRYTNVTMRQAKSGTRKFPGGLEITPSLGYYSLGAPDTSQTFSVTDGDPFVGKLVISQMASGGIIPSKSWGMHIGSATLKQSLSLVFGGYDRSRLVSDPFPYDSNGNFEVEIMDIAMGVAEGISPVENLTLGGRLGSNGNFNLKIDPLSPYMYLPSAVCQAMVEGLPVTYDDGLGLYLWNTDDPAYEAIIDSPLYLDFQFYGLGSSNNSIKLPMTLFDLTLTAPIKSKDTPYFPCRHTASSSDYALGRAFLQGAFIGMNWEEGKFWMGQAPGPSSGASVITSIKKTDTTISKAEFSWNSSWANTWKVTSENETQIQTATSATPLASTSTAATSNGTSISGLSPGAMAGIGVGSAVVALCVISGALYFIRRRRDSKFKNTNRASGPAQVYDYGNAYPPPRFHPNRPPIYEVEGSCQFPPPKTPPARASRWRIGASNA